MKAKKIISLITALVIALSVFAGCTAKKDETPAASEGTPAPKKTVTIQFWHHWGSEQRKPTITAIIDEFNARYKDKGIQVEATFVPFGDMSTKLTAAITAGDAPDAVIQPIEAVGIKAARNQVEDITKYITDDIKNLYYENYWDTVVYEGKVYALPFNTDTRLVFYNKKMFADAGINEFPKTWDEMLAVADKLDKKAADGSYSTVAFIPTLGNFGFDTIAIGNGGNLFDDFMNPNVPMLNSKQNVEALEWMAKWRDRYGQNIYNSYADLGSGANDLFITGKVAMLGNVCNYIATLNKYAPDMDYGVAPLPAGPSAKELGAAGGGFIIEVPKGSKHVAEATEFVKFMSGEWATSRWAKEQRDVMINKAANEEPSLKEIPAWQSVLDLMIYTHVARRHPYAPDAGGAKGKAVEDVMAAGVKTPKEALDFAQKEVEQMIKDNEEAKK